MRINTTQRVIKNLILDLGVVIVDLTPSHCLDIFQSYGVSNVENLLDSQHKEGIFLQFEAGKISADEFRNKLRELSGLSLTDKQIDNAWNGFLGDIPSYKLNLLEELRKNFNLYLLSNTNSIHWEWMKEKYNDCQGHSFEEYFKELYLSYQLKMIKPERNIFEYVLKDRGMRAEETFFIDDSLLNCDMANSLGITTYTPKPQEDWNHLFSY